MISYKEIINNTLLPILIEKNLTAILLYSSRNDSRLTRWFANTYCSSSFHYIVVTKADCYFLEVSYRCHDLSQRTDLLVQPFPDEDLISSFLAKHFTGTDRIGLAGEAPFHHISQIKAEMIDIHESIMAVLESKSPEAIDGIKSSIDILKKSLADLSNELTIGWTGFKIAKRLEDLFRSQGGIPSFPTSVVIGETLKETTVATPKDSVIWSDREPILIDCGVVYNGYYTDITRMLFPQNAPKELKLAYQNLSLAQQKVGKLLKSGSYSLKNLFQDMSQALLEVGLDPNTLEKQDLGHGIGYTLHEKPLFYREDEGEKVFKENCIITLEPEIIYNGYRLRVEDMFLVGKTSGVCLTKGCHLSPF